MLHNEREILSRRDAVKRIARRAGNSDERAEDIAQEAALQLIANPNLASQTPKQAFIDAVRSGGERTYLRSGRIVEPLYEGHFENYADFVNAKRSDDNLEGRQISRGDLLDTLDCLKTLRPNQQLVLERYAEGFKLDEISKQLRCSPSRIHQLVKFSRIELKAAIVQTRISRQKQKQRKWAESQALPRSAQAQSSIQREGPLALEAFCVQPITGLVSFALPKIPQGLFVSF